MRVEPVYPASLGPPVDILSLHEALVLRLRQEVRQQECLLVVELVPGGGVARDDDVGPVAAAHGHVEAVLQVERVTLLENNKKNIVINLNCHFV